MPPKAVAYMRFVNLKTVTDYIPVENLLTSCGGKDDYVFKFEPEELRVQMNGLNEHMKTNAIQSNEVDGNEIESAASECNGANHKKVITVNLHFIYSKRRENKFRAKYLSVIARR